MRALVTGATGFVGKRLLAKLERPVVLSRDAAQAEKSLAKFGVKAFAWDPTKPPPAEAFDGIDAVIPPGGRSGGRGPLDRSEEGPHSRSRVAGTRNLVATLRAIGRRPEVLVSASAVGLYGDRGDEQLDENSPPASDFLADVCRDWEHEATEARAPGHAGRAGARSASCWAKGRSTVQNADAVLSRDWAVRWAAATSTCRGFTSTIWWAFSCTSHARPCDERRQRCRAQSGDQSRVHQDARQGARPADVHAARAGLGAANHARRIRRCAAGLAASVSRRDEASGYVFQFPELEPALWNVLRR